MEENSRVNNDESKVVKEKQQNFLKYSKTSLFKSDFAKKSEYLELKRSINKLLLDEETVQKIEDARETKFYFEKLRQLELCRLTLMVMAQAVAILDYEIEFHDQNGYYAQWFLYIILICSIILSKFLLVINFLRVETIGKKLIIITELNFLTINYYIIQIVIMTYFSYQAQNQFIIATKQYGKEISIFNTEMGIYLIFPQPWFQKIKVYFFVDFYQIRVYHYLNEILLLIMLLRFIIMAKIILMNTQWYNERVNRICNLYATKMSPLFILKVFMKKNPMRVFWFFYVFCLFIYSYGVRICERPLLRDPPPEGKTIAHFNQYGNSIWCTMITIPTIGYGDTFPVTNHGRFIASITFISGTFLFSILCNSLLTILDFSFIESKSNLILNKLQLRDEIKKTATRMFAYVAKMVYKKHNGESSGNLLITKLRDAATYFKQIQRSYKSYVDQSNLAEQVDKQFTYIKEEIGNLESVIDDVSNTQKALMSQFNIQSSQNLQQPPSSSLRDANRKKSAFSSSKQIDSIKKRKEHYSSIQYYTEDMLDCGIKQQPYSFSYNMINHINPNQFY